MEWKSPNVMSERVLPGEGLPGHGAPGDTGLKSDIRKVKKENPKFKNGLDYSEFNTSLGYLERPWSREVGLWWRAHLEPDRANKENAVPCTLHKP